MYLGYFAIVGFIAVKHIEVVYLRRSDEGEEQVYKLPISLLFTYLVIILAPFAIFAPGVGIFDDISNFRAIQTALSGNGPPRDMQKSTEHRCLRTPCKEPSFRSVPEGTFHNELHRYQNRPRTLIWIRPSVPLDT